LYLPVQRAIVLQRVLIVHPHVVAAGGAESVAAWTLHALKDVCDLSLLSYEGVDCERVNRHCGTSLAPGDFEVHLVPPFYRRLVDAAPTAGALLRLCAMMRPCRRLDREREFDVIVSTTNEMDFGRRGIQYVHFPWMYLPRPEPEMRWYHRVPGVLGFYRGFATRVVGGLSMERMRQNVTIANSEFVAGKIRSAWLTR
jgi:hypothetical protein